MKAQEVLMLAQAGFTKDDIAALLRNSTSDTDHATVDEPSNDEETTIPSPGAAPANKEPVTTAGNDEVLAAIKDLTAAIQASSLITSSQPEPETVDDILAKILNS